MQGTVFQKKAKMKKESGKQKYQNANPILKDSNADVLKTTNPNVYPFLRAKAIRLLANLAGVSWRICTTTPRNLRHTVTVMSVLAVALADSTLTKLATQNKSPAIKIQMSIRASNMNKSEITSQKVSENLCWKMTEIWSWKMS